MQYNEVVSLLKILQLLANSLSLAAYRTPEIWPTILSEIFKNKLKFLLGMSSSILPKTLLNYEIPEKSLKNFIFLWQ